MTEEKESSLSSSTEERDSGCSPSWSLGEDGQKRASLSDVEGTESTEVEGPMRRAEDPSLTVRESEGSSGRIVESTLWESPDSSGGGVSRDSVSSDSEEEDEGRQTGVWLVLRLLSRLLRASRRCRLPLDRLRGCRSEGPLSAADVS